MGLLDPWSPVRGQRWTDDRTTFVPLDHQLDRPIAADSPLHVVAMLGFTNHAKVPQRRATMFGLLLPLLSFTVSFSNLIAVLVF